MKKQLSLILLLSALAGFGQQKFEDHTKITAYTVYEEFDDGPCSVLGYVNDGEAFVKKVSVIDCKQLVLELLAAKRGSHNWKNADYMCRPGSLGGQMIPNMVAIEYNNFKDTIFMTAGLKDIFDCKKQKAYRDDQFQIKNILSKNRQLKTFVETDFAALYKKAFRDFEIAQDSVDVADLFDAVNVYGYSPERIETLVGSFDTKQMTILYDKKPDDSWKTREMLSADKDYAFYNFSQDKLVSIRIDSVFADVGNTNMIFSKVCGISAGDTVEKLKARFPTSTQHLAIFRDHFPNSDGTYEIVIRFRQKKGYFVYIMQGDVVSRIQINFNYLN